MRMHCLVTVVMLLKTVDSLQVQMHMLPRNVFPSTYVSRASFQC